MIKTPLSTVLGGAFWTPGATVIGGNTPTFDQIIKSLFANNEQGFFYDPNDLSTMYQNAAGTVPVTAVGQPVGLMLDKSKGLKLGVEKSEFANGFSSLFGITAVNGSNMTLELSNGVLEITSLSGINNRAEVPISGLSVGGRYIVSIVCRRVGSTGSQTLRLFTPFSQTAYSQEINSEDFRPYLFVLEATAISGVIRLYAAGPAGGAGKLAVESVSVKELFGSHAYQTTSSMRPLLNASPQRLDFDTADDKLITTLPAQITGCTVIRSVPNVGTQILTGQTIPATYNDNTGHCGLIVINRALTPSETSVITSEFNKRAGV